MKTELFEQAERLIGAIRNLEEDLKTLESAEEKGASIILK